MGFVFDLPKIASYRAIAATRLGAPKIAERAFEEANRLTCSPKQAAVAAVERARGLVAAGHVDTACEIATQAYAVGRSYESERVCQAVRDFRLGLPKVPSRYTDQLDHELRSSYAIGTTS